MPTFAEQIEESLETLLTSAEYAGVDLQFFSEMAAGAINLRLPQYTSDVSTPVLQLGVMYAWALLRRRQSVDNEESSRAEIVRCLAEADKLAQAEREEISLQVDDED